MRLETLTKHEKLNISLKEIACRLRKHFKVLFPSMKFSITTEYYSMGQCLNVSLVEANIRITKQFSNLTEETINNYIGDNSYRSREQLKELVDKGHYQLNQHSFSEEYDKTKWNNGVFLTVEGFTVFKKVVEEINHYNWDDSDSQTDYYDVHFHLDLSVGKYDRMLKQSI